MKLYTKRTIQLLNHLKYPIRISFEVLNVHRLETSKIMGFFRIWYYLWTANHHPPVLPWYLPFLRDVYFSRSKNKKVFARRTFFNFYANRQANFQSSLKYTYISISVLVSYGFESWSTWTHRNLKFSWLTQPKLSLRPRPNWIIIEVGS